MTCLKASRPRVFIGYWLLAMVYLLTGCVRLDPAANKLIVRAEQTTAIALETFDLFLKIERDQEAALLQFNPRIHTFAELLRREAPGWLQTARHQTAIYKASRYPPDAINLTAALAILQSNLDQASSYMDLSKARVRPASSPPLPTPHSPLPIPQ